MDMKDTNLTKEDAVYVTSYLEKDLDYYNNGLKALTEIKQAKDNMEFEELLDKHKLDPEWTMDEINAVYNNTVKLIDVLTKVRDSITLSLTDEPDEELEQ